MDSPLRRDHTPDLVWPQGCLTRVPFRVFAEEKRLVRADLGPIWNFLCLKIETPDKGDWRLATAGVGDGFAVRSRFCVLRLAPERHGHLCHLARIPYLRCRRDLAGGTQAWERVQSIRALAAEGSKWRRLSAEVSCRVVKELFDTNV
jgi:hypothetical protein